MPPKKQKDRNSTVASKIVEEARPTAVIIAELESERFQPIPNWMPTCLLGLGNVPLLQITLNQVLTNGFKKIIIFACSHKEAIEKYVKISGLPQRFPNVQLTFYDGSGCKSIGEAMRVIDNESLLHEVENFICIPGDLVADFSLIDHLKDFAELRRKNPNIALGMIFSERQDFIPPDYEYSQLTYKAESNVLVNFRRSSSPVKMISVIGSSSLIFRRDIIDTRVLLCSKHIPIQFQGNFDFRTIDDLVNEFLLNEDVMAYQTHIQILQPRTVAISVAPCLKHLLHFNSAFLKRLGSRRIHPPNYFVQSFAQLVEGFGKGQPYALSPQCFVYKSDKIHESVKLLGNIFIGRNVTIRRGCTLIDVVIDDNCVIEKDSLIQSTVLMSGVHIGSKVEIVSSWLFTGACIHDGVKLGPHCFVGPPMESEALECPHNNRLCITKTEGEIFPPECVIIRSTEKDSPKPWTVCHCQDSNGSVSFASFDSSDEDSDSTRNDLLEKSSYLWRSVWLKQMRRSRSSSDSSISLSIKKEKNPQVPENDDDDNIICELENTLKDGLERAKDIKDLCTEITCLKHATGITIEDLIFLLTKAVLKIGSEPESGDKITIPQLWEGVRKSIDNSVQILRNFVKRSSSGEALCLQAAEENCILDDRFLEISPRLFHHLYDEEIVSEEAIKTWVTGSKMLEDSECILSAEKLRERLRDFLNWLDTAESEDDDDNEDDDDDGEDEEENESEKTESDDDEEDNATNRNGDC